MLWLVFLYLEIGRRVMWSKTVKILTKCFQFMQDLNLNIGTPIFKIRILAQFGSRDFFK